MNLKKSHGVNKNKIDFIITSIANAIIVVTFICLKMAVLKLREAKWVSKINPIPIKGQRELNFRQKFIIPFAGFVK